MGCRKLTYYREGEALAKKENSFLRVVGKKSEAEKKCINYYPFGMQMPGRHFSSSSTYRYGFQGQEMDNEFKGKGNSVNYKYRMHDPRLGRFFAVDPLTSKYPHYTPYSFSGNKVIHMIELEGLEEAPTRIGSSEGESEITKDYPNHLPLSGRETEWFWHQGSTEERSFLGVEWTKTNEADWYKRDDYFELESVSLMINNISEILRDEWNSSSDTYIGASGLFSGIAREYYIRSAKNLQGLYTLADGSIDYDGGIAARTKLKSFVRNRMMTVPSGRLFDTMFGNTPPDASKKPRFWRTNKLVNIGGRAFGVVGAIQVGSDWYAVMLGKKNAEEVATDTFAVGIMTFGGPVGFTVGLMNMAGKDAKSFGVENMIDNLEKDYSGGSFPILPDF